VRASEESCPFCRADQPASPGARPSSSTFGPQLARAAILAGVLAGCEGPALAAYGGPPPPEMLHVVEGSATAAVDAAAVDVAPDAAPIRMPVSVPAYGGPPPSLDQVSPVPSASPDAGARRRHPR
jgi:hypothetical protein